MNSHWPKKRVLISNRNLENFHKFLNLIVQNYPYCRKIMHNNTYPRCLYDVYDDEIRLAGSTLIENIQLQCHFSYFLIIDHMVKRFMLLCPLILRKVTTTKTHKISYALTSLNRTVPQKIRIHIFSIMT